MKPIQGLILATLTLLLAVILLMNTAEARAPSRDPLPLIVSRPVKVDHPSTPVLPLIVSRPITNKQSVPEDKCRLVDRYNWPKRIAYAVCLGESGGRSNAVNWRDYHRHAGCWGSFGLMQVGCFWPEFFGRKLSDLYDPEANMEMAYKIYQRSNSFKPWGAYTNGSYKRHLNRY